MNTCPKCGKEIPEGTTTCPECGAELTERPMRRVPNIPRREPDSLPERPGKEASSDNPLKTIMIAAIVIVILIAAYLLYK